MEQVRNELKAWQRVANKSRERAATFECSAIPPEHEKRIRKHVVSTEPLAEYVFEPVSAKSLRLQTKAEKTMAAQIKRAFDSYKKAITRQAAQGKTDSTSIDEMCKSLGKRVAPILKNVYTTTIAAAITDTGVPIDTDRYKNTAQEWAENYTFNELKGELETTTINNVQRMVSKLLADPSLNAMQVAAGLFPTFSDYRVSMIAITEVTRAKSAAINGYYTGLTEDGFDVVRRWGTRLDERVCPICGPLDNKKEETYKKQFNDGPPAHPNCRCFIGVEVKAENTEERRDSVPQAIPKPVAPKPAPIVSAPKPVPLPAVSKPLNKNGDELLAAVKVLGKTQGKALKKAVELQKQLKVQINYLLDQNFDPNVDEALKPKNQQTIRRLRAEKITQDDIVKDLQIKMGLDMRKLLYVADPIQAATSANILPAHQKAVDFVSKLVSKETLTNNFFVRNALDVEVEYIAGVRAHSNGTKIFLKTTDSISIMVHELGHNLDEQCVVQENNQTQKYIMTGRRSKRYLLERAQGKTLTMLRTILPHYGFEAHEVTYKGAFKDHYTGKLYPQQASEVLSNGIQSLYNDPYTFATNDPAHFRFVVNTLRGFPND